MTSDMLYFLMSATKTFWKRLIENYPTKLQGLSEILPLTWYQWISHLTSQPFSQLPTITIFTPHVWSTKLLFCMDAIYDIPTHGKKIYRKWEKYTEKNIKINEIKRKEGKITQEKLSHIFSTNILHSHWPEWFIHLWAYVKHAKL